MRIIFMGTPDFAVPTLDALVDAAQRFGQLAVQLGARLPECEANPVMIAGDSLVVADARAVWLPGAPSMS